MRTELISIPTDTLPLDGAFYLPDGEPSGAVMLFHGNTMSFYIGAPRFLPPVLTRLGFACLWGAGVPGPHDGSLFWFPALPPAGGDPPRVCLSRVQPTRARHSQHPGQPGCRGGRLPADERRD